MNKINYFLFFYLISFCFPVSAEIDKVYHPYVEGYKSEIEYRMLYKNDPNITKDGTQFHRLSFGHSLTERFSMEAYAIGEKKPAKSFSVDIYELEAKLQLTEQGEYWSDWGLLFELERNTELDLWETGLGALWEKEWDDIITSFNYFISYEVRSGKENKIEPALRGQVKYRWSRFLEPAMEVYADEKAFGMGPVFLGSQKIGINKLKWELGLIFGLNDKTANQNLRLLLDYEF